MALNEGFVQLQESNQILEEELGSNFESTEKAIVISDNVDAPVEDDQPDYNSGNPFLTEDVMAFMPDSKN